MSNSEDRLTQTGDVAHRPARKIPDAQDTVAKGPTAKTKSPKGKALKTKEGSVRHEARAGARRANPRRAGLNYQEIQSDDGASTKCDTTDSESDNAGLSGGDDTDRESNNEPRADPRGQSMEWYESDYRARSESSDSE